MGFPNGCHVISYDPWLPADERNEAIARSFETIAHMATPEGKAEYKQAIAAILAWSASAKGSDITKPAKVEETT